MSNLLFDEPPQMFQPRLAAAFNDVNEAIVLQQIHYWLKRTSNVRDGRKWVYNSMANWQKQFYWIKSRSTLTKIFKDLVNRGLLIEANYNKAKFDRTKWYTIDYDAFHEFEQALYRNCTTSEQELDNATSNSCTTYTIDYTETTTDINNNNEQADASNAFVAFQTSGATLNGFTMPQFVEYVNRLGDDLVKHAIELMSVTASKPSFSYLKAILDSYENAGITTVEQAEEMDRNFKEKREQRRNSRRNNNNTSINSSRDLSNKHYGTAEEIERQLFGDDR